MMITKTKHGASMACVSILFAASACGSQGDGATASDNAEVVSLENALTASTTSRHSACSASADCFGAFEDCELAAAGADDSACRSALEACLPAEAPRPSCDDDASTSPPVGDAGVAAPTTPLPSFPPSFGDAGLPDLSGLLGDSGITIPDFSGILADGGVSLPGAGNGGRSGDRGGFGAGRGGLPSFPGTTDADAGSVAVAPPSVPSLPTVPTLPHGRCDAPVIPTGVLGGCRDAATGAIGSAVDPAAIQSAHLQCVLDAFAPQIEELCTKASDLCAQSGAPADVCQHITDACSAASTAP